MLYYKNVKDFFRVDIVRHVSTKFLVFPNSTCVDLPVYQHGKCFIFANYNIAFVIAERQLVKSCVDIIRCSELGVNTKNFLRKSCDYFLCYIRERS